MHVAEACQKDLFNRLSILFSFVRLCQNIFVLLIGQAHTLHEIKNGFVLSKVYLALFRQFW